MFTYKTDITADCDETRNFEELPDTSAERESLQENEIGKEIHQLRKDIDQNRSKEKDLEQRTQQPATGGWQDDLKVIRDHITEYHLQMMEQKNATFTARQCLRTIHECVANGDFEPENLALDDYSNNGEGDERNEVSDIKMRDNVLDELGKLYREYRRLNQLEKEIRHSSMETTNKRSQQRGNAQKGEQKETEVIEKRSDAEKTLDTLEKKLEEKTQRLKQLENKLQTWWEQLKSGMTHENEKGLFEASTEKEGRSKHTSEMEGKINRDATTCSRPTDLIEKMDYEVNAVMQYRRRMRDDLRHTKTWLVEISKKIDGMTTNGDRRSTDEQQQETEDWMHTSGDVKVVMSKIKRRLAEVDAELTLKRPNKGAGTNMTHDNPNIADLSDPKRPAKLAEMYSELFDNEWTHAFSVMTKEKELDEKEAIKLLCDIIKESYNFCKKVGTAQMECIRSALILPASTANKVPKNCQQSLSDVREKVLLDLRKEISTNAVKDLQQVYIDEMYRGEELRREVHVRAFVEACVELCWLMIIQCPPVFMDTADDTGKKLNKDKYKPYTNTGKKIDFVVWPAIYLFEKGGLLLKGVAQPVCPTSE